MSDLIPIDEVVYFDVTTHNPATGAVSDADSTPTFDVYEEATDTGLLGATNLTKRTSLTGHYRGTFTASAANGFEAGKWYAVIASATVNSIAAKWRAMHFRVAPAEAAAGVPKADLTYILGTLLTETAGQIAAAFKKFFDKATPTGTVNSLPDAVAGAASGLAIVGSDMGSAASVTADVGITQAGADKVWGTTVRTLSAAGVQAIWDALTSALTTAGSIGKWILDKLDVVLSTRLATSGYTVPPTVAAVRTEMDANSTRLAAIDAKTTNLPGDPADASDIAALFAAVSSVLGSPAGASVSADIAAVFARLGAPAGASTAADIAAAKAQLVLIQAKTDTIPASPAAVGSAMTLTSGERTAVANEVEAQIIDETDSEKVLTAITDKIAAVNPDLSGLTLAAIAAAVRDVLNTSPAANSLGAMVKASADRMPGSGTLAKVTDVPTAAAIGAQVTADHGAGSYARNTEPDNTSAAAAAAVAAKLDTALEADGPVYRLTANALEQAPTGGSAPSAAAIRSEMDANSVRLADIQERTDLIPDEPADQPLVTAGFDAVTDLLGAPTSGTVAGDVAAVKADTGPTAITVAANLDAKVSDAGTAVELQLVKDGVLDLQSRVPADLTTAGLLQVDIKAVAGSSESADRLGATTRTIVRGTVLPGSTPGIIRATLDPPQTDDGQFTGLVLKFAHDTATAGLRGQGTEVLAGGTGTALPVTPTTEAAVAGDVFTLT